MKNLKIYCLLLFGMLCGPNVVWAQKEPNDVVIIDDGFEDFFYEAIQQRSIENYDKAIEALEKGRAIEPENPVVYFELGKNYLAQKKYKEAYDNFEIKKVATYKDKKFAVLMQDSGIIRNRLKINAAIENAKVILQLQKDFGTFKKWIEHHHPSTKDEWVKLFKKNFKFTGGEIVNEFLMSAGYLQGAHAENCPVYKKIAKKKPMWMKTD